MMNTLLILAALGAQDANVRVVRNTAYARVDVARRLAGDSVIQAAVAHKNAGGESREEVQRIDAGWSAGGEEERKATLTRSRCADRLREAIGGDPVIAEAILMDEKGALVCSTGPTSDYDQSDELKWSQPVREGKAVFIDEPAYDESSDTYAIQLSVPVQDGAATIGALTLTLRLQGGGAAP
jgi:hypothetical protein